MLFGCRDKGSKPNIGRLHRNIGQMVVPSLSHAPRAQSTRFLQSCLIPSSSTFKLDLCMWTLNVCAVAPHFFVYFESFILAAPTHIPLLIQSFSCWSYWWVGEVPIFRSWIPIPRWTRWTVAPLHRCADMTCADAATQQRGAVLRQLGFGSKTGPWSQIVSWGREIDEFMVSVLV